MGAFNRPRYEAMARGVAAGKTIFQAAVDAGYGPKGRLCYKHTRRDDGAPEVERWKLDLQRGGSGDLAPVVNDLMAGAQRSMGLNSAGGMMAAYRMLTEAARLKQIIGSQTKANDLRALAQKWVKD
jgi:hypothetical protein